MKRTLQFLLLACALTAGAVQAQTANSAAGSIANSGANAGSNSGATAIINFPATPSQQSYTSTSTSTSTLNTNASGSTSVKMAPQVVVSGPASGPCNGFSAGVGGSWMGGGLGFNMSKVDEGCEERETARIYAMMGDPATAKQILDNSEVMQRTRLRQKARDDAAAAPKAATVAAPVTAAKPSDADLCAQARAKDDKPLAMRVCTAGL